MAALVTGVAALLMQAATPAVAQQEDAATAAINEGLRRQLERDRAQRSAQQPHGDVLRPAAPATTLPELPDDTPCFTVTEIVVSSADGPQGARGPQSRLAAWLTEAAQPFLNRCIGAPGLSRIAGYLDAQLIHRGLVTSRVSLGQQNLATGTLAFKLHAGRIAGLRMVDADAPGDPAEREADSRWGTWRNAFPTAAGGLLDARDLEQGVEQMKRLPSQSVTTLLAPGDEADTSIVTLVRRTGGWRDRLRGGLTLDNAGSASLGRMQLSANLSLDNALGLSDVLSLGVNTNVERPRPDHRTQSLNASYSVPWGYATFSASASQSRFAQNVLLPTQTHRSSGNSHTAELRLDVTALRTASAKVGVYTSLSTRRSSSAVDDTELTQQRRKTTFLELGLSLSQWLDRGASLDAQLGYRHGVPWLNAQRDLIDGVDDPGSVPSTRPHLWSGTATVTVPFTTPAASDDDDARPWQYSLSVHGQRSGRRLLSVDQIALGNRASVRGFDGDTVLLAESGAYLRNELATPLPLAPQALQALQASLYLGLDIGRVWGPSAELLTGHRLAGAVAGARGRFHTLQFDIALGAPLSQPAGMRSAALTAYLNATCAF